MEKTPQKNDTAFSPPFNDLELSQGEKEAVRMAEGIAQGQSTGDPGAGSTGGGGTVAPPPPAPNPNVTNAGRLAVRTVDQMLTRLFGPAGPLPPNEHDEAEQCWSELLTDIGIAIPTLGPGGKLLLLYGVHVGSLYAITWLMKPEKSSSPDSPGQEKQP